MSLPVRFPGGCVLRPARAGDAQAIQRVEQDADMRFSDALGSDWEPDWTPSETAELAEAAAEGGLFTVEAPEGGPCGYLWMEPLGGAAHIAEMAVTRAQGRKGLGRLLLATAEAWAVRQGFAALTLTTFRDVPWNAPFYARCGFTEIAPEGALAEILAEERAHFAAPRIAMRKTVEN